MFTGIVFGISALLLLITFLVFRGGRKKHFHITLKVMAIFYMVWVFSRYFMADGFIWVINKGYYGDAYYESVDVLQSILRWGHYLSYTCIAMSVFFKSRLFKNICIYICVPFAIVCTFNFSDFMNYFMDPLGEGFHLSEGFRQFHFSLELILAITIPLMFVVVEKHFFAFKNKTEWKNFLFSLPFIILLLTPIYVPQSLFGYTDVSINSFTIGNAIWFFITVLEIYILYKIFRFKSYNERFMLCMFLAIALFMHYNSTYLMGIDITKLPFHLCNLAVYFFIFVLLTKNVKFFNFVFLANVVGTVIAMLSPDITGGVTTFWNVHFTVEHMQVLVIPMLCMLLRIFPRINKEAIKHLAIGFTCYFLFCFVVGTIINGFADSGAFAKVNYFFIFDVNKFSQVISFLPFNLTGKLVLFGKFAIYPLFQIFIYFMFLGLCLLFYLLLMKFYDFLDDHYELRKAKIEIYEKLTGKKYPNPRTYEEVDLETKPHSEASPDPQPKEEEKK